MPLPVQVRGPALRSLTSCGRTRPAACVVPGQSAAVASSDTSHARRAVPVDLVLQAVAAARADISAPHIGNDPIGLIVISISSSGRDRPPSRVDGAALLRCYRDAGPLSTERIGALLGSGLKSFREPLT